MSRYSSAVWKPIQGTSTTPVVKDILCLHTMVGYLSSTWLYFNRPDVSVYSHIGVGGVWGSDAGANLDGVAWQMADTNYRAAANLNGNDRIISVETADNAVRPIEPWTPKQCDAIVQIMVDAHRIDGIPLVLIPDSRQGRRGIAYHRLGCDPYRVADGELWSSSFGKDCPTQARIDQIPELITRANAIVNNPTGGGILMALSDSEQTEVLRGARSASHVDAMLSQNNTAGDVNAIVGAETSEATAISALSDNVNALHEHLTEVDGKLDQIIAALGTPPA